MCGSTDRPNPDVLSPDDVSFQTVHEGLYGPVLGPVVVPDENTDADGVAPRSFESEQEVRQWAHESGLDLDEVRQEKARPFVVVQPLSTGWIASVYLIET